MAAIPTAVPKDRLSTTFERTRTAGRAALIGHLPADYPNPEDSITALRTLSWHADVLIIGLPGSPTLTASSAHQAPRATLAAAMETLREVSATTSIPVMLASHWAPLARTGVEHAGATITAAGAAGVILLDLPPAGQDATRWLAVATAHQLPTTFLANRGQAVEAASTSTGWVYLPAVPEHPDATGVLDLADLHHRTGHLRCLTSSPICTGTGITSPELAAATAPGIDGVVVDSAFLHALQPAPGGRPDISQLDHCATRYAAALRTVPGGRRLPTPLS